MINRIFLLRGAWMYPRRQSRVIYGKVLIVSRLNMALQQLSTGSFCRR